MTQQEVIKTFMHSLDETTLKGSAALNEAIKASSNFKSFKAVRTQFLNDLQSAKNWQTFLVEKCGIVLDNTSAATTRAAPKSKLQPIFCRRKANCSIIPRLHQSPFAA